MIYADGSALRRSVAQDPEAPAWRTWLNENAANVVVSEGGLVELRRAADARDGAARQAAHVLVRELRVARIPDRAVDLATRLEPVLGFLGALHIGVAVAEPDVDGFVTYDRDVARVARMHGLTVLSPGRPDAWWL
ncbi:MAG: hypothetical protein ACTMIR_12830 [Cellulomonadaceae bacterium]